MKKKFLLTPVLSGLRKKALRVFLIVAFSLTLVFNSYAHRVETYIFSCVASGQTMTIDANLQDAPSVSWYNWQYKVNGGPWTCFINGINTINGTNFNVSGVSAQNVFNDVPTLTINNASAALENVLVRVLLRDFADPCTGPAGTVFNGDDLAPFETKYLRLHLFSNTTVCPPNAYLCQGNLLVDANGYYGGFENRVYDPLTDTYTNNNFGPTAGSTDFISGMGLGHYQHINNPYAMTSAFARDIAPHTGNTQMVVMGSFDPADRVWYKGVNVSAGRVYQFDVWAARVDNTNPKIALKVNGVTITENDLSVQPIGNWVRISGQYNSTSTGTVIISVGDNNGGVSNNYTLDDLCFRVCTNCISLPLQSLELRSSLHGNIVGLKWITVDEVNTDKFVVQRSTDGINYSDIASKIAVGQARATTEYQLSDDIQTLSQGSVVYYRIKAVDIDGKFSYSNVVPVKLNKTGGGVQIWPNPFVNDIRISYTAAANTSLDIRIIDNAGRIINQGNYNISRGLNQLSVNGVESLSPGIYIVRITDKNTNESFVQKLIK